MSSPGSPLSPDGPRGSRLAAAALWILAALLLAPLLARSGAAAADGVGPGPTASPGPIRHVLLLAIAASTPPPKLREIEASMSALGRPGGEIIAGEWGRDLTEGARTHGYTHAFVLTFRDTAAIGRYRDSAAHRAFVELTAPFLSKPPLVMDYRAD